MPAFCAKADAAKLHDQTFGGGFDLERKTGTGHGVAARYGFGPMGVE